MSTKKKYGMSLSEMRANLDTNMRYDSYFSLLLCADEMMFTYDGLPDTVDEKHIEDYLNISGSCGWGRGKDGNIYIAPYAGRTGKIDQYGDGTELDCDTPNGINIKGTIGVDVAVMYNNTARFPQTDLIFDSMQLTELDKSSTSNVIFARIAPLFSCVDDKTKDAVKEIIQNVIEGNVEAVVSQNLADMLGFGQSEGIKTIDMFDHPERVQYLQYLSQFYDVIMRRHFSRRGLTIKTPTKAAQQSTDEIHGLDSVSWYYPLNKLKARQDALKDINRIFGTDIKVRFSDIWQQEYDAYLLRILQQDVQSERETEGVQNDVESVDDGDVPEAGDANPEDVSGV